MTEAVRNEIKALIAFYEERGKDWLLAVSYTAAKATGHWPPPKPFKRIRPAVSEGS